MSKTENLPAKKQSTEVGQVQKFDTSLGYGAEVDNSDIIVEKIHLMQSMSKLVKEGVAREGEYRSSLEGKLLGSPQSPVELIVFKSRKAWQVFEKAPKAKKAEYKETVDFKEHPEWHYDEVLNDGTEIHRDLVLSFYCLSLAEIKEGMAFPYIIDFKRTSRQAGQQLATYFAKLRSIGKPSYAKVFALGAKEVANDNGTFYVKSVGVGRDATQEEIESTQNWLRQLLEAQASGRVKEDDSDLGDDDAIEVNSTAAPKGQREF